MQVVNYCGGSSALGIYFVLYMSVDKDIQSLHIYFLVSGQLFRVFVMCFGIHKPKYVHFSFSCPPSQFIHQKTVRWSSTNL